MRARAPRLTPASLRTLAHTYIRARDKSEIVNLLDNQSQLRTERALLRFHWRGLPGYSRTPPPSPSPRYSRGRRRKGGGLARTSNRWINYRRDSISSHDPSPRVQRRTLLLYANRRHFRFLVITFAPSPFPQPWLGCWGPLALSR